MFSHIIHPTTRAIIPYHQHTISHTVILPCSISSRTNIPYHISCHTAHHATPYRATHHDTIPILHEHHPRDSTIRGLNEYRNHRRVVPTNTTSMCTRACMPSGRQSRSEYRYRTAVPTPQVHKNVRTGVTTDIILLEYQHTISLVGERFFFIISKVWNNWRYVSI